MKALLCEAYGPPSSLSVGEIDDPVPGQGEVVIDVKAAGMNFFDTLIIEGKYQYKPEFPFSPGAEVSGVASALGPGAEGVAVGDRVAAHMFYGGCREKVVVDATRALPLPERVSFEQGAGLIITYGTTIHALRDRADLQPGETLAVLGASGGTGLAAVELGKLMGARVIACASSDDKLALCREHGADETLNYSETPLRDGLKELTGGRGVDVVYDPVGGDFAEASIRAIAWKGRYLVIGFAAGAIPKIPLNLALLKGCSLVGVFWGNFAAVDPEADRANDLQLLNWADEGKLRVHVDRTYALDDAAEAIERLAARKARGKLIVTP